MQMQFLTIPVDEAAVWPKSTSGDALQDKVYRHIIYLLTSGYFRPGETLSLRQLSSALNVSETPVRNALNRLLAENALDVLPNRHVMVPLLTRPRFDEIMDLRKLIEPEIAVHSYRRTTRADIARLEDINNRLLEAIASRKLHRCVALNQLFHLTFYELADRPLTFHMIWQMWLRSGAFMFTTLLSDDITWRAEQHGTLIEGLKMKDMDACVQAIHDDVSETYKAIIRLPNPRLFAT